MDKRQKLRDVLQQGQEILFYEVHDLLEKRLVDITKREFELTDHHPYLSSHVFSMLYVRVYELK